ncbi:hypothetical protein LCGC14_2023560 [marine sediment metagenome]|uniref:Uncharacterized protein n=1 Tax=marine sediment metagenome TaxID=412755 RepID=A0A0F9EWY9_9ZZZZ
MAVEHLTKLNDDGTLFGQSSSDKIGFYGLTTPIVRPAMTAVTTTTATTALNETRITRLITALVNLGLVDTTG